MRTSILLSIATATFATCIQAQTVEFFYTETVDLCSYDNTTITANEQTTHGGICAWRPDVERVYGCPAPDPTCWTWGYSCPDSTVGQTVCNRAGTVWCCNAQAGETCTTTSGQINVCISDFSSPDSGVSIDKANEVYLSAIGLSNVTATSQSVEPTPFSTRNIGSTTTSAAAATSSSSASSSSSSTTSSSSTSSTSTATGTSGSTSGSTAVITSSKSISGGAIAGIVVGAIVVIALVAAAFFIGKRRSKARNSRAYDAAPSSYSDMAQVNGANGYYDPKTKFQDAQYQSSELGDNPVRAEMPSNYTNTAKPAFRPQELP